MRINPKVPGTPEPTIGELIRSLMLDLSHLVRTEIKLAQAEVGQSVSRAKTPVALIAIGGLLMFGAFLCLLAAFVGWLATLVGPGWAALIVAVIVGGAGAALVMSGARKMKGIGFVPTRSVMSLKQDAQALKGKEP